MRSPRTSFGVFFVLLCTSPALLGACGKLEPDAPGSDPGAPASPASPASPTLPASTDAVGLRVVGAACAYGVQCASGACSADTTAGSCGTCLEVRALGERCDAPGTTCRASAACVHGVCVSTKKTAGQSCNVGPKGESFDCDDELYCAHAGPLGPEGLEGTCTPRGVLGGKCDLLLGGCVGAAQCERSVCVAARVGLLGDTCDVRACATGLFCRSDGTCQRATLVAGDDCGRDIGGESCVPGTQCELTGAPPQEAPYPMACLPGKGEGELCASSHCAEGLFCDEAPGTTDFRCKKLGTSGDACTGFGECAASLECRAGVCRPACR
jgi:hypothetical protein